MRKIAALEGQIIVIASRGTETPAPYWESGSVVVRLNSVNTAAIRASSAQPDQAPYYLRPSSVLGGGAIGLVPFAAYESDHSPGSLNSATPPATAYPYPIYTNFNTGSAIHALTVAFYGPIEIEGTGPGITLYRVNPVTGFLAPMPESAYTTSVVDRRFLRISGANDSPNILPQGAYRVFFNITGSNRLLCDDLLTTTAVPVKLPDSGTEYEFYLRDDCTSQCNCATTLCFLADWDADADTDSDDVLAFQADFDNGNGDIDMDGDTDSDDTVLFHCLHDLGGCP